MHPMEGTVLITALTGTVGRRLAGALTAEGVPVRGVVPHLDDAPAGELLETVAADLADPVQARRAVEGVDAVFLTPPLKGATPLEHERDVVRSVAGATKDAGVGHLMVHTALHADRPESGVRLLDAKARVEKAVQESGVPWTIVRPGLFLDTLLWAGADSRPDGFPLPMEPDRRFGAVAARDVARAARVLLERGPQERAFDLHIPGGVSARDVCTAMEELLERPYRHERPSIQDYRGMLPMAPAAARLHADLVAYAGRTGFTGDPHQVQAVVPEFRYTTLKAFLHEEVFPRLGGLTARQEERRRRRV